MNAPANRRIGLFRWRLFATFIVGDSLVGVFANTSANIAILWYVVQNTDSGAWLGIIAAAKILPAVLGAFISGPAVNRIGSRRLVLLSRGAATFAIVGDAVLLALDALTMPVLALLSFCSAVAVGPSMVADTTRFPEFTRLARIRLARFNALDSTSAAAAGIGGMLVTAWVIDEFGLLAAISIAACASVVATVTVGLGFPADNTAYRQRLLRAAGLTLVGNASRFLLTSTVLAPVLLAAVTATALVSVMTEVVAPLVVERSGAGPDGLAAIFIVAGLAAMLGSAAYGWLEHRLAAKPLLCLCLALFALSTLVLALSPTLSVGIMVGFFVGLAAGILEPICQTKFQRKSPKALRSGILGVATGLQLALTLPVVLAIGLGEAMVGLPAILFLMAFALALALLSVVRADHRSGDADRQVYQLK